jgi:hypothetical protein
MGSSLTHRTRDSVDGDNSSGVKPFTFEPAAVAPAGNGPSRYPASIASAGLIPKNASRPLK